MFETEAERRSCSDGQSEDSDESSEDISLNVAVEVEPESTTTPTDLGFNPRNEQNHSTRLRSVDSSSCRNSLDSADV